MFVPPCAPRQRPSAVRWRPFLRCGIALGGQTHQRARQELDLAAGAHLECRHGYDPQVMWNFECPSCGAKYLKTKIEHQAENREGANCEHCLASFEPREGADLFQYELIEHPSAGR